MKKARTATVVAGWPSGNRRFGCWWRQWRLIGSQRHHIIVNCTPASAFKAHDLGEGLLELHVATARAGVGSGAADASKLILAANSTFVGGAAFGRF